METKVFRSFITKASDEGIVEAIVAVFGNVDEGGDVIHPGSCVKTISERLGKMKVLDMHRTDSLLRAIGKPMAMREMGRAELPAEMLTLYPEATGGLWTKTQFLIDTPEGEGAFKRIKAGVVDEWSIGYDALDKDMSKVTRNGKETTVRNLRTLKLYEYSPVLWGMNEATGTLSAKTGRTLTPTPTLTPTLSLEGRGGKRDEGPEEGKPYGAVHEGEVWRVYKLDEDGEPTGEALGEHETEEEALAQARALYANEDKSTNLSEMVDSIRTAFSSQFNGPNGPWNYWTSAVYDDHIIASYESDGGMEYFSIPYSRNEEGEITFAERAEWVEGVFEFVAGGKTLTRGKAGKEMTEHGPVQRLGHVLQGTIHRAFTTLCDDWYVRGLLSTEERIQLSGLIGDALDVLEAGIPEEVSKREPYANYGGMPYMMMSIEGPSERKAGRVLAAPEQWEELKAGRVLAAPEQWEELKAGRVLAARNAKRIMEAMNLLHEAMADAGLMDPMEGEDEDDEGKLRDRGLQVLAEHPGMTAEELLMKLAPEKAASRKPDEKGAGPDGDAAHRLTPTSDEEDASVASLLRLIEIEQAQIKLLEV